MSRRIKLSLTVLFSLALLAGVFFAGFSSGYRVRPATEQITELTGQDEGQPPPVDFSPFWRTWTIINDRYVNGNSTSTKKVTDQDKVWGAISGLVDSLGDPYSVFLPPKEKQQLEEEITGNFGGVGIELGIKNNALTVVSPLPNTPAKRAGVKAGDRIIKIDGASTADMTVEEAVSRIRGKEGTKVTLVLTREGASAEIKVELVRARIEIPTIETELLPGRVFVIRLYNFSANSPTLFRNALRAFVLARTNKMIIDLRGNPGGLLEASTNIASWFLAPGQVVVREYRGANLPEVVHRSRGYDIFNDKLKLVVLVDRGTASAAEILAGVLQEYQKGVLVGEKTFGKGSVQEVIPLTADSALKLTIARWLTPQGRNFSKDGLVPDIIVKIDENTKGDPQLDKAVAILAAKD